MSHASLRRQSQSDHSEKVRRLAGGGDAGQDKAMIRSAISQHENAEHGGKHSKIKLATGGRAEDDAAKVRMDRPGRKKGGRTGGKTHVNVIVAPQGGAPAAPAMPPHPPMMPPPGPPAAMPPRPPMGPPVGAGAPMGMPHKDGGRVGRKGGGAVQSIIDDGAGSGEGRLEKIKAYGHKKTGEGVVSLAKSAEQE